MGLSGPLIWFSKRKVDVPRIQLALRKFKNKESRIPEFSVFVLMKSNNRCIWVVVKVMVLEILGAIL